MKYTDSIRKRFRFLTGALLFSGIITGQPAFECLLKAKALSDDGKNNQAISILSAALESNKDGRLFAERADAELNIGKYDEAISDYTNANSRGNSCGEYGLARAYALMGDAANSVAHLEKDMKSSFRKSEKEIMLDPAFDKIENKPEWRTFWKTDWYSGTDKSIAEIEFYISSGKTNDAISAFSEFQKDYQGSAAVDYAGALINLSAGKYADVIKTVTPLSESDPLNEKYLRVLAKAQEGAGNPAGALVTYSKLIEMEVPDAELFVQRAECYRKTGETDKALADLSRYLDIYPESKNALSLAGRLESAAGNNMEAISYFNKNLILHPNDPDCYIDRANSYLLSKSWDYAANDYGMSLDLAPGNPEVWLNKGIALANSGKTEDACHDFRQALSLGSKRATEYISRYCIK
ncbi:MAG: tetratricopeptide repeat protein [Bacteroidales bacterium]